MEPEKSTKLFSDCCEIHDAEVVPNPHLVLPEGETFRSLPPCVPLAQVIRRGRELRRWFPHGLRSAEERWQAKSTEEFHL